MPSRVARSALPLLSALLGLLAACGGDQGVKAAHLE
jgi:hypothetical protein